MSCDSYSLFFSNILSDFPNIVTKKRGSPFSYLSLTRTGLAADSSWNNSTLTDALLSGLSPKIKDHLISLDIGDNLNSVIALIHKIDRRSQDRERTNYIILRPSLLDHRLVRINLRLLHPPNHQ